MIMVSYTGIKVLEKDAASIFRNEQCFRR